MFQKKTWPDKAFSLPFSLLHNHAYRRSLRLELLLFRGNFVNAFFSLVIETFLSSSFFCRKLYIKRRRKNSGKMASCSCARQRFKTPGGTYQAKLSKRQSRMATLRPSLLNHSSNLEVFMIGFFRKNKHFWLQFNASRRSIFFKVCHHHLHVSFSFRSSYEILMRERKKGLSLHTFFPLVLQRGEAACAFFSLSQ